MKTTFTKNTRLLLLMALLLFAAIDCTKAQISVIRNPTADGYVQIDSITKIGNILYCRYGDGTGSKNHLAKYDGNSFTVIPNVSTSDIGYVDGSIVVGSTLYFRYFKTDGNNSRSHLAKYDGNTLTVIPSYFAK